MAGAGGAVSTGPSNDGQGGDLATRFQQPIFLMYAALTFTLVQAPYHTAVEPYFLCGAGPRYLVRRPSATELLL